MSKKVRVGIIGTSWWAEIMFLPSLKSHESVEIIAICGRDQNRASEMADKYNIPQIFANYRQMIEKANLDAIIISTPDDLHHQMTMDALDHDLHVLCEKPMALNVDQAREMYQKAKSKNVINMILFPWRWMPHFKYIKTLIDDGYLGSCFEAQFRFVGGFGNQPEYLWRFDGSRANGVLGDLGAHMFDFSRWYMGEISRVSAQLNTVVKRPGIDGNPITPSNDSAFITLEFESGAHGLVHVTAVTHTGDRNAEIGIILHGDSGTIEVKQILSGKEAGTTIKGIQKNDTFFKELQVPGEFLKNLDKTENNDPFTSQSAGPRAFIDAILDNTKTIPSFYDGLKTQEIIDAAQKSHHEGTWVSI